MNQRLLISAFGVLATAGAFAQVPDLVTAFDAGGRAMGMGGASYQTGSDTLSNYYNPAGLAFIDRSMLGITFRNFPQSRTVVTGDIGPAGTQRLDSTGDKGPTGMGHAGLAIPIKNRAGGNKGVIAISTTAGGQLRDERVGGAGLQEGGIAANGYSQLIKSDTDFVNLSYASGATDGSFAYGLGVVYAINRQVNNRLAPSGLTLFDAQATGIGIQGGVITSPKDNPDLSFGLSLRSPISLKSGGNSPLIYSRIPGRIAAGLAMRRDGFRSDNKDFMVLAADIQHFFGGSESQFIDRNAQTVLGAGLEYHYSFGGYRVPLRLGYSFVPAGGDFYGRRNSFTFGLGVRPVSNDWAIDVNFGRPSEGGSDLSVGFTYKFGK